LKGPVEQKRYGSWPCKSTERLTNTTDTLTRISYKFHN